ncbi:hypothetical protein A2996_03065 [Candidatus Campbellbacteria bacterium RIFCSPLOWO2_01_FULL_34_15]|uniref:Uncharacterized protein n=2 Tax=Candidatus Campbelliibacteriota TaxID=1752727 RepID=A0A1F5EN34_9BACT|nr:MAG: hypothetical protein A2811_02545 [Candidatus Campbellbacteria bacterium RIFCSPHIGHO2_01_FULL_34_10]OGD68817.1 MAG: hypothetical protein A2996_03065 [Candidatus Campbellbacteria bacterium RIFCSPLOWO2_01_FULL_34_15]
MKIPSFQYRLSFYFGIIFCFASKDFSLSWSTVILVLLVWSISAAILGDKIDYLYDKFFRRTLDRILGIND